MTSAQFWLNATYAVGIGLVCVAAAVAIFEARALASRAKRISHSLFPPSPAAPVTDINEHRRRFAGEPRVYGAVQQIRQAERSHTS